jgi:hypothetical protein
MRALARHRHNDSPVRSGRIWQRLACSRIAWAEFSVGFSRRDTGAEGARDFVSLLAFFGLMTFLTLLGWSVRDGLWGRIEQVLLGALTQGQPPIRLSYHIDNTNKINTNVLREFMEAFPNLDIVPERSANGTSEALILPSMADPESSWGQGQSDKRVTTFRIDALPLRSPLWSWILAKSPARELLNLGAGKAPLLVAASRHLFQEHFRYDTYRTAILANRMVPCDLKAFLPERIERIDDIRQLVLEVKENITTAQGKRSTVPSYQAFRVIWVDSFPTPEQTAMVVPLSTYELLLAVANHQTVELDAEALEGAADERISQIRLAEIDLETDGISEFDKLARCLGVVQGEVAGEGETGAAKGDDICKASTLALGAPPHDGPGSCDRLRERMPLKYPRLINNGQDLLICAGEHRLLRGLEVGDCAQAAGLTRLKRGVRLFGGRLDATPVQSPQTIEWLGPSRIAVPCGSLSETDLMLARALHEDRARSIARAASDNFAPVARTTDDQMPDWMRECVDYKSANPTDSFNGPRAILTLDGYQDVTVYPVLSTRRLSGLRALGTEIWAFLRRGFQHFDRVAARATREGENHRTDPSDDRALNTLTKSLLAWETTLGRPDDGPPTPVFRLDPAYESALVRFGVLSLILDKVSTPLAAGSLALYIFLTAVILATAIAHRRRQYGLLLMSGTTTNDVGYIVALQIMLSCIFGGIAGYAVFLLTAYAVNALLTDSAIVADARMIIGLDVPSFLPSIGGLTVAMLWGGMTFLAILVGSLILRLQGITTAQAPIELVKS